jgi:hypothetical protein
MLRVPLRIVALLTSCLITGCAAAYPYTALIYSNTSKPGATEPTLGLFSWFYGTGTSNTVAQSQLDQGKGPGSKTGKGSVSNVLNLFAAGDASVAAAANNGRINTIHTIDQDVVNFLGIDAKITTRVTGE